MMASSSAMTTRVVTVGFLSALRAGLGQQPVEQLVLVLLEATDLVDDLGAVPLHGVGVALGVLVLALCERRLGHKGPQPGVVGRLGEVRKLLLGDGQLLAELLEARADLGQAALDEGPGHRRSVRPTDTRLGSATML